MATPTMVTITGQLREGPTSPDATATVTFRGPYLLRHLDGTVIEKDFKVVGIADANGQISMSVPATDDPAWSPQGWTYRVSIDPANGTPVVPFDAAIPSAAASGGLTLGAIVPVGSPSAGALYAPINHTHSGYISTADLTTALQAYVSDAELAALGYATSASVTTALQNYVTTVALNAAGFMTADDVAGALQDYVTVSGLNALNLVSYTTLGEELGAYTTTADLTTLLNGYLPKINPIVTDSTFTVAKASGAKIRWRSNGGAIDIEKTNGDIVESSWQNNDFTGTQTMLRRWRGNGFTYTGVTEFGSTVYASEQAIDGPGGVARLGAKNGLSNLRICGYRNNASGPPTTGTWAVDDIVMDVNGQWWRCKTAGTPGSWDGMLDPNSLSIGESTIGRRDSFQDPQMTSGAMVLTYFTAMKTETINTLRSITRASAAVGTTLARKAIYDVAANGDLTLAASTPNDVNLWNATYNRFPKNLSAPWNKVAGRRYAYAQLWIGTTGPRMSGMFPVIGLETLEGNRENGTVPSQTDIPNTVANASILNTLGISLYAAMVP